jgi:SAM-dependent methyltransferase
MAMSRENTAVTREHTKRVPRKGLLALAGGAVPAHYGRVTEPGDHWDQIYDSRAPTELSWFQRHPETSLRLIEAAASGPSSAVVDVGAGASVLVDELLARGFTDITLVEFSRRALERVRERLGDEARCVRFVHRDLLTWVPERSYDVWHDRAVFHFLTEGADRERYVEVVADAICGGGSLILGTFAQDGPTSCSGLPVRRYSADELAALFARSFSMVGHEREEHLTPSGTAQSFTWVVLRRK